MEKNKTQEEVIETVDGQLIVIACPGAGKTTTLVRRINHMITDCGIESSNILMVTFTTAAAKEMKERYCKMYGENEVTFSTIHSLCLSILKKFCGITKDNILSNSSDFFYEAIKKNKKINDKDEFVKSLLTDISVLKNNCIPIEKFIPTCCEDEDLFRNLYQSFEEYKKKYNLIDFDDMLNLAYKEMLENEECLLWLRNRFKYIQIDEYQDTNFIQRDILYLLAGEDGNLAVVGDDDQSIYGFRGATPEIMLKFKEHYPNAKTINMSTNYRSCKKIISNADFLIKKNKNRFQKDFVAFKKEDGDVKIFKKTTKKIELFSVLMHVKKLIAEGEDPSNIAILYRTNQQAEGIASLLNAQKIPFVSTEKIPNKYEHWIFRDIQSFQRLSKGEKWNKQDLIRVLNHPQRFLHDYQYIQAGLNKKEMRSVAFQIKDNWKKMQSLDEISNFFALLEKLKDKNPKEFLKTMVLYGRYLSYLKDYASFRNVDYEELFDIWSEYEKDVENHNDWKDWGLHILKYKKALEVSRQNKKGVVLSTMHCSKGLEWKHVFIIDCVDGVCPFKKAKTAFEIEEERRLFYVAMTRAKENLYMYTYEEQGNKKVDISPFLQLKK